MMSLQDEPAKGARLCLLGPFRLALDEREAPIPGGKMRALLSYLASTSPQPQPRERLMALLWSKRFEGQARQSLRHTLSKLRKLVGPGVLIADGAGVAVAEGSLDCDVARFEVLAKNGSAESLRAAVELYRGDFLSDLSLREEAFEAWMDQERQRIREMVTAVLAKLADRELQAEQAGEALELARRAVELDPCFENGHRCVMRALAAQGHRGAALEHYRSFKHRLADDLGARPDAETERLRDQIESGNGAVTRFPERPSQQDTAEPRHSGKPSVAVLPFTNRLGDPGEEYFSDGITEDIITELSRFRSLFVAARHASFAYKNRAMSIRDIGRELGVQYIVEGSVRRAEDLVRITVQLIEVETSGHVWAERYDRKFADIFAVQDEVTRAVVRALGVRLSKAAVEQAQRKPTENLTAYGYLLRGEWYLNQDWAHEKAWENFEKAVALDPQCARALARLAVLHTLVTRGARREDDLRKAQDYAESALASDDQDPFILSIAAVAFLNAGNYHLARRHIETAITLNPNDMTVFYHAAFVLGYLGEHAEALKWIERALAFGPHFWEPFQEIQFDVYYMNRKYEEAIETMNRWRSPHAYFHACLAAACAQLGRMDEMKAAVSRFNIEVPDGYDFPAAAAAHAGICKRKEDADHWLEGYRKAGLLE